MAGVILAGVVFFTLKTKAPSEQVKTFDFSAQNLESIEINYNEYISNLEEELQAEEFLDRYDTEDLSFYTFDDAITSLQTIPEFNNLGKSVQCRTALREVRKQNCKSNIKYLKEIARKTKLGAITISKEGTVTIVGPNSATLKSEVNRLNGLVTSLNYQRQTFCDARSYCNPYFVAYHCDSEMDSEKKTTFKTKCEPLVIGEQQKTLERVLAAVDKTILKYNDSKITDEQAKAVMNSEIDQLKIVIESNSEENPDKKKEEQKNDTTKKVSDK